MSKDNIDGELELGAMTDHAAGEFNGDTEPVEEREIESVPDEEFPEVIEFSSSPPVFPVIYHPMAFVDVVMVLPSTHPVVILEEIDAPHRQLRIPVGSPEGIAISYGARKIDTPKPLTHEFFQHTLETFGITIETVRITAVERTAYSAEIIFSSVIGQRTIACRPSDAIALVLRQGLVAPITAAPDVLDQAGFAKSPDN